MEVMSDEPYTLLPGVTYLPVVVNKDWPLIEMIRCVCYYVFLLNSFSRGVGGVGGGMRVARYKV